MPEPVAQLEQAGAIAAGQHRVVLVEVGDVVEVHAEPPLLGSGNNVAGGLLERPQAPAEGDLLVVVDPLLVEYQHAEPVHAGMDRGNIFARERLRDIATRHHAGEEGAIDGVDGFNREAHRPPRLACGPLLGKNGAPARTRRRSGSKMRWVVRNSTGGPNRPGGAPAKSLSRQCAELTILPAAVP